MKPQRDERPDLIDLVHRRIEDRRLRIGGPGVLVHLVLEESVERGIGGSSEDVGDGGGGEGEEGDGGGGGDGEGGGGGGGEGGADEGVGGVEGVEGGAEEGNGEGAGEEEGEDGDAGAAGDGAVPAVLGAAEGPGMVELRVGVH